MSPTWTTSSARPMALPSTDTGTPASNPMTSSTGSVAVGRVRVNTSSGGDSHGSSSTPHSMALPHRFSSMEYGLALVTFTGMSWRSAYSIESSRVSPQVRTGASTSRSGASARVDTSKRTWSLPLPVQPWATPSAPNVRAASTRCSTMIGRDSDDTSGYRPSYRALALSAGATNSLAYCSHAVDDDHLDGAGGQRPLADDVEVATLADVDGHRDHLDPPLLGHPAHGHRRVQPAAVGEHHSLCHLRSSFYKPGQFGQPPGNRFPAHPLAA